MLLDVSKRLSTSGTEFNRIETLMKYKQPLQKKPLEKQPVSDGGEEQELPW